MRTIKISLAVITVAAIVFFVARSFVTNEEVGEIRQSYNEFIGKIQQEIKALQLKPENKFCKDYYNEVTYHIDDYFKTGRFGKSQPENDQWKENLSKQLYAAYVDKFIKQAFYVFDRSDWEIRDLSFIRSEYRVLQSSPLLERYSPIDERFNEIKTIFDKYDEISAFISNCKGFTYFETKLDEQFPIDYVSTEISDAKSYLNNGLDNSYVNNCTRLRDELAKIPQVMFEVHTGYLDSMITYWTGSYIGYPSQKIYRENVWTPVDNKIDSLVNNIYNVSDLNWEHNHRKIEWAAEGAKAYDTINSK